MASAIATTSVAPERGSPIRNAARPDATIAAAAPNANRASGRGRQVLGWLEDAGLSLLLVLALPLVILAVGAPVALVVWLVTEIGRRWS
jgi:hypothetical protein